MSIIQQELEQLRDELGVEAVSVSLWTLGGGTVFSHAKDGNCESGSWGDSHKGDTLDQAIEELKGKVVGL